MGPPEVYPDHESLSRAAAGAIVEEGGRAMGGSGADRRFTMALAGGSTPRRAYELLAVTPLAEALDWRRVHVFWSDERCVDPADARSNERMVREALLDRVAIPAEQVHAVRCAAQDGLQGKDCAERAAVAYEATLRRFFPLDLVVLGLGDDGHTASLFPSSAALAEESRWVAAVPPAAAGTGPHGTANRDLWRVTLTAPFINTAACVLFVVSGAAKAAVVRDVLEGPADTRRLPAQLIRLRGGRLRWLLDKDAAALLAARPEGGRTRETAAL